MKIVKRISILFLYLWILLGLVSCGIPNSSNMTQNKQADLSSGQEKYIITAEVVQKNIAQDDRQDSDKTAFYVRRSIQDYYIKFCESDINRAELEQRLETLSGLIKTVKLQVSYREGTLDECENRQGVDEGQYIVVHQLF